MNDDYICSVPDCGRAKFARDLCQAHYKHVRAGREPGPIAPRRGGLPARACGHESCDRPTRAGGFCQVHYYQNRRNGVTVDILPPAPPVPCSVKGCQESSEARGWCPTHYRQLWYRYAKYGITEAEYRAMLDAQGGGCAICARVVPPEKQHVDHDHRCCPDETSCGECVRGILCDTCNVGIGFLKDEIEVLESAIQYLKKAASTKGDA